MLEKCANYEGEDRGQGRNSGCTSKESLFHSSMGPSPFSSALLACHGIWESYSDKAGIKAREWLPPALRTLPTVDEHGEKGLEDRDVGKAFESQATASVQGSTPQVKAYLNFIH